MFWLMTIKHFGSELQKKKERKLINFHAKNKSIIRWTWTEGDTNEEWNSVTITASERRKTWKLNDVKVKIVSNFRIILGDPKYSPVTDVKSFHLY